MANSFLPQHDPIPKLGKTWKIIWGILCYAIIVMVIISVFREGRIKSFLMVFAFAMTLGFLIIHQRRKTNFKWSPLTWWQALIIGLAIVLTPFLAIVIASTMSH